MRYFTREERHVRKINIAIDVLQNLAEHERIQFLPPSINQTSTSADAQ